MADSQRCILSLYWIKDEEDIVVFYLKEISQENGEESFEI